MDDYDRRLMKLHFQTRRLAERTFVQSAKPAVHAVRP